MRNWAWAAAWGVAGLGIVLASPALAQKGKRPPCISEQELEAAFGAQIDAGATMLRTAEIDDGRPMCAGTTVARWIHRRREAAFPAERDERLAHAEMVKADVARLAAEEEDSRIRRAEAERLEELARIARARQDAAEADAAEAKALADMSEEQLRAAKAQRALAALPPYEPRTAVVVAAGSVDLDRKLEDVILLDSQSWWFNKYRRSSTFGSKLLERSPGGEEYVLFGKFFYTDGSPGWLKVRYTGGVVDCLIFHDQPNNCRALGDSLSMQAMRTGFNALLPFAVGIAEEYVKKRLI